MNPVITWQLASFAILGIVILVGFAWFERHRPSARVAAAIATLAAFAVVGRIAFAPFPNVKPTSDIIFISGYTLGGAPGFMVGALAGLVSNFYFGQGPWTPWQMTAWGVVGVLGAVVGTFSRQRLTRFQLSLVCAASAFVFGAIVNLSEVISLTGEPSQRGILVVYARALPFDVAHAVGNFAFCMLAGPLLVRMLQRVRRKSELEWPATTVPASKETPKAALKSPAGAIWTQPHSG
ncbi:MAG: ECF transporter S component [Thermoleophilaceae bacterium]|nr:ECF transporter S component [Thermoleophilaceae bacterium]